MIEVAAVACCVVGGEAARYPSILAMNCLKLRLDASKRAEL